MTITNSPSGKKAKRSVPNSAPTRLPSARERRPALAALAVLLIVGGAVLAGWLALRQSQTSSYVVVVKEVSPNTQIERADLGTIDLPSEGTSFVPASRIGDVVDSYAQGRLFPNQVLVDAMFGPAPDLQPSEARIGLDLQPAQYPPGLNVGDTVIVELLNDVTDSNTALMLAHGSVRSLQSAETGGGAIVDVVVPLECADEFASGSANGNVALYVVPVVDTVVDCAPPPAPPAETRPAKPPRPTEPTKQRQPK